MIHIDKPYKYLSRSICAILVLVVAFSGAAGCKNKPESKIEEQLNKEVTKEAISEKAKEIEASFRSSQKNKEIPKQVKANILKQAEESLKRDRQVFSLAKKEGVKVKDKEVDKRLSQIKASLNKQKKDGFKAMLKTQNKTEQQFKDLLYRQVIFQELNKKISKGIRVSDKEIEAFYNDNKNNFKHPTDAKKVRGLDEVKPLIRQILISQKASEKMRKMLMTDRK